MALSDILYQLAEEIDACIQEIEACLDPNSVINYGDHVWAECDSLMKVLTNAKVLADRIRLLPGLDLPP